LLLLLLVIGHDERLPRNVGRGRWRHWVLGLGER
jgi:hypothetical protein